MHSTFSTHASPPPAPLRALRCVGLLTLALAACTSDDVSLGAGESPGGGSVITAQRKLDLTPLHSLRRVQGSLQIGADPSDSLESLDGLEGLERVTLLSLFGLDITSLGPLRNLTQVGRSGAASPSTPGLSGIVSISNCNRLSDLTGLENLTDWDQFLVFQASALESLRGLTTSRDYQVLDIWHAPNLRDLASLGGSESMDAVRIADTGIEIFEFDQILYLRHLELAENPALTSVDGMRALQRVQEVVIRDNDRLEQLPELPYLGGLTLLSIQGNDALRAIPSWIDPDDGDFLAPEYSDARDDPGYFYPPEFYLAEITNNAQLSELALPSTFRFGGHLRIRDNPRLTSIDLSFLDSADHLSIANNPELRQINLPVLKSIDELQVVNNPHLPAATFENVRSFSIEMQGNLGPAGP
jgi:hypothetical protein